MALKKMNQLVFSSKDFSLREKNAIIYGVFIGWNDASYKELQAKFNWSDQDIREIQQLRQCYLKIVA